MKSMTWVREGGKMYYGTEVLKTKTFWKVMGVLVGVPLLCMGALLGVAKLVE